MKKLNRITAVMLSIVLALSGVVCMPVFAAEESGDEDLNLVKGAYNYFNFISAKDSIEAFYYSDDYFCKDSEENDLDLAIASLQLDKVSFRIDHNDLEFQADNIGNFLRDVGFSDVEVNSDFVTDAKDDTACAACAHKTIYDNGKPYTLLVILTRGASYQKEWMTNLHFYDSENDTKDHFGHTQCKEKILEFTRKYISSHKLQGDLKVWTTGFSRGGGIANLVGADLIRDPKKALGSSVELANKDVFCYTFGASSSASIFGDYADSKFARIHNYYDEGDMGCSFPPNADINGDDTHAVGFTRYGTHHPIGVSMSKFHPKKLNEEALAEGRIEVIDDDESYLPDNQPDYMNSVTKTLVRFMERESKSTTDGRKAVYETYQDPARRLITWVMDDGIGSMNDIYNVTKLMDSEYALPMIMTCYMSVILDKNIRQGNDIDGLTEDCFNQLTALIADENGKLQPELSQYQNMYDAVRLVFFKRAKAEDGSTVYVLKKRIDNDQKVAKRLFLVMRKLAAEFYGRVLEEKMVANGDSQETIDTLTSDEDTYAMSWMFANMALDNIYQSDDNIYFSLDNEQFKQFATFFGNLSRLYTPHFYSSMQNALIGKNARAATAAQQAGYRRVYVTQSDGVSVTGTVVDAEGNTVAEFRDGKMLSRSDDWIGMTTCDSGNWLRLPADQNYKIRLNADKSGSVNVKVADFSIKDGNVVRTVRNDNNLNWTGIAVNAEDTLTLNMPAALAEDGSYDTTSTYYSMDLESVDEPSAPNDPSVKPESQGMKEIYSKKIPKAKSVKAKAAKKAFTVKWKKLSTNKRKKFSKVEIQYSTDKSFKKAVKTKEVSKNKKSYKVKKLKKGSTYYVRVRNIKYSYNKKYVSKWSSVKKVKVR